MYKLNISNNDRVLIENILEQMYSDKPVVDLYEYKEIRTHIYFIVILMKESGIRLSKQNMIKYLTAEKKIINSIKHSIKKKNLYDKNLLTFMLSSRENLSPIYRCKMIRLIRKSNKKDNKIKILEERPL